MTTVVTVQSMQESPTVKLLTAETLSPFGWASLLAFKAGVGIPILEQSKISLTRWADIKVNEVDEDIDGDGFNNTIDIDDDADGVYIGSISMMIMMGFGITSIWIPMTT